MRIARSLYRCRRGGTDFVAFLIAVALIAFVAIGGVGLLGDAADAKFEQEAAWLANGDAEAHRGTAPAPSGSAPSVGSPPPSPGPVPAPAPAVTNRGPRVSSPEIGISAELGVVSIEASTDGDTATLSVGRNVGIASASVGVITDARTWIPRGAQVAGSVGRTFQLPGGMVGPDGRPLEVGAKGQVALKLLDGEIVLGINAGLDFLGWSAGFPGLEWTLGRVWGTAPTPAPTPGR